MSSSKTCQRYSAGNRQCSPSLLTAYDGMVFFVANDNIHGRELWKSDGTLTGTKVVKDITPGSSSTSFNCLFVLGNWLYFSAYTSAYGGELWKTDGTSNGTVSVTNQNFSSIPWNCLISSTSNAFS